MVFLDITGQKPIPFFMAKSANMGKETFPSLPSIGLMSNLLYAPENIDSPLYKINYLLSLDQFQEENIKMLYFPCKYYRKSYPE
jgi:hypothetical protein